MLDIGFLELMLIGIVGLLVLGPERLPRAARTAGMWIGKIKRTVSGMQREISAQLEAEELRQKLNDQQKNLDDSLKKAKLEVESIADAPTGRETAPKDAAQSETEKRVAKASSRLDDALQTVREDPASTSASSPPSASESTPAESEKAESEKDRNHQ
ncbi:Sec-independent protein translocase protein TatB [Halovibrio sp. HP20-50]|uniref:Sec-independent protein translocase protein TatB n=1 Tax=Halovibrio sp. HP20-59 TaxID=3080275 RepID=UPI00294AEF4F|nr:Sec-independent protein translocase protein TatB [Halovibrio sp. HP20-59]MEA2116903.1 Sec-independent protein translocase protein TatB [Halovibrio sp. HP20-59]